MIGCSSKGVSVVQSVRVERVKVPRELLELEPLQKPIIKSEIDILNAYSMLFYKYKQCVINIEKIRELGE
ncbi:hypothetical protein [Campylobacter vulpis]|uniref:hypothetical protein n=1 Tax=Campylobacter vulpis TaxID=1655500 RepID=UPI001BCE6F7F|nr:hypothetical protein [Campylobacter vulpis]